METQKADILISIIIPAYNCADYLKQSLDSLLIENLEQCEVLVVDDGSTDSTKSTAESYQNQFEHLEVLNQANRGASAARNYGIRRASGTYLFFFDADDIVYSGAIDQFKSLIAKQPKVDMFKLGYFSFKEDQFIGSDATEKCSAGAFELEGKRYIGRQLLASYYKGRIPPAPFTYLVRRSVFTEKPALVFPEQIYYEDASLFSHLLLKSRTVQFTQVSSVYYRVREGSVTNSCNDKHVTSVFEMIRLNLELQARYGFNQKLSSLSYEFGFWQISRNLMLRRESMSKVQVELLLKGLHEFVTQHFVGKYLAGYISERTKNFVLEILENLEFLSCKYNISSEKLEAILSRLQNTKCRKESLFVSKVSAYKPLERWIFPIISKLSYTS
jgi:glycosyltransferase involved in cell wall biosynthesis